MDHSKKRYKYRAKSIKCTKCGKNKERHRYYDNCYCLKCHAEFNRASAKKKPFKDLSPKRQKQILASGAVRSAVLSGTLLKLPCKVCGNRNVQGHHEDYDKPLEVVWLCVKHHLEIHGKKQKQYVRSRKPVQSIQGLQILAEKNRKNKERIERKRQEQA